MRAKLHVGNLPVDATEQTIRELFTKAGTVVSVMVVKDLVTGQSTGVAFVEMASFPEIQAAISLLNESELQGQRLTVRAALLGEAPVPYHNRSRPKREESN